MATTARASRLTLDFDAFIPAERIANPAVELPPFFAEFLGDNRDFSLEATRNGQSRLFSQVVLDTESLDLIVSSFAEAGTSVGFLEQDGVEVSLSDKTTPTSFFEATRLDDSSIRLEVAVSGINPLIKKFLPPDVEAAPAEFVYEIFLTLSDDTIGYKLVGTNRAYPNYSVFLNGKPILQKRTEDANNPKLLDVFDPVDISGELAVTTGED